MDSPPPLTHDRAMSEDSGTAHRRLTRSSSSKVIAGVAGGLGEYTGLDPVIFRIGFIALAVAGGSGLLMYLLAWLVIPQEGKTSSPGGGLIERTKNSRWVPIVLIGVAVVILIDTLGTWGGPGLWAVALIAIGIALLQDEAEPLPPPPEAAAMPGETVDPAAEPRAPRVRRRRSPLGAYTLGAALLMVAIAVGLSSSGAIEIDVGQHLALVLLTLGAGLILGAWWGRARLLIVLGIAVIPFMLAASALHVPIDGYVGDRYVTSGSAKLADRYEVLAGSLEIDLSRHRFGPEPTELEIDFVLGDIGIWVPPGVEVITTGSMDAGKADLFGDHKEGTDIDLAGVHRRPGLTEGTLIVDVRGGLGSFDTSWATWIEQRKRRRLEREQREEARADGIREGTQRERNRGD